MMRTSWTGVDDGTERRMGRANGKSEKFYEKIGVGLISNLIWEDVEVSLTEALWLELEQELYLSVRANGSICAQRGKDVGLSARGFDGGLG